ADRVLKDLFPSKDLYALQFLIGDVYKKVYFSIEQTSESKLTVTNSDLGINGTIELNKEGKLLYNLSAINNFNYRFVYKAEENKKSAHNLKQFVYLTDDFNKIEVGDDEKGDSKLKWFGLDFDYH